MYIDGQLIVETKTHAVDFLEGFLRGHSELLSTLLWAGVKRKVRLRVEQKIKLGNKKKTGYWL